MSTTNGIKGNCTVVDAAARQKIDDVRALIENARGPNHQVRRNVESP
jgi:hypothetical protein